MKTSSTRDPFESSSYVEDSKDMNSEVSSNKPCPYIVLIKRDSSIFGRVRGKVTFSSFE